MKIILLKAALTPSGLNIFEDEEFEILKETEFLFIVKNSDEECGSFMKEHLTTPLLNFDTVHHVQFNIYCYENEKEQAINLLLNSLNAQVTSMKNALETLATNLHP